MNLYWPFARKPEPLPHVIVRHVVATKSENATAKTKRDETSEQLRLATDGLSPDERHAAIRLAAIMPLTDKQREGRG